MYILFALLPLRFVFVSFLYFNILSSCFTFVPPQQLLLWYLVCMFMSQGRTLSSLLLSRGGVGGSVLQTTMIGQLHSFQRNDVVERRRIGVWHYQNSRTPSPMFNDYAIVAKIVCYDQLLLGRIASKFGTSYLRKFWSNFIIKIDIRMLLILWKLVLNCRPVNIDL
jgi:hypothetical protein